MNVELDSVLLSNADKNLEKTDDYNTDAQIESREGDRISRQVTRLCRNPK